MLYKGDCLEIMPTLEPQSIDAIITDIPYGTTACKWDIIIPFDQMWKNLVRLIKPNGAIVLFGSEPFSSLLRISKLDWYKYDWIWKKSKPSNFANAKKMPLKIVEYVHVFCQNLPTYNPQGLIQLDSPKTIENSNTHRKYDLAGKSALNGGRFKDTYIQTHKNYPNQILDFKSESKTIHPTQKPVVLMEYLIKTYSNENDVILDFTMGSGSTGVAALNTNRRFIGIEKDEKYFTIAKDRINAV